MNTTPQPNKKSQLELAASKVILIVLAIVALLFVVWAAWILPSKESASITNYQECVAAGNPVQESSPEVCIAPDGQRFTKETE